jgi:hypothetical protein
MAEWTDDDQALLWAYQLREYLRENGQLYHFPDRSHLYLESGEETIAVVRSTRVRGLTIDKTLPENTTYFRLTYSFAKDPLVAPFMWILLLPFNLISMLFSRAIHTKTTTFWHAMSEGDLAITNRALLGSTYGGQLRFSWRDFTAINLSNAHPGITAPPGIHFRWKNQSYFIEAPTASRLGLMFMMRYLAAGSRGEELQVPDGFIDRARRLGKLE